VDLERSFGELAASEQEPSLPLRSGVSAPKTAPKSSAPTKKEHDVYENKTNEEVDLAITVILCAEGRLV